MNAEHIDWSQIWHPGPTRTFTPAEMARAGGDQPSRTFVVVLLFNLFGPVIVLMQMAPEGALAPLVALLAAVVWPIRYAARVLWRQPTRRRLSRVTLAVVGVFALFILGLVWRGGRGPAPMFFAATASVITVGAVLGFWLLALFRAHQIAGRLRELDDAERAQSLARQLATAQIQPHFIFNTLAALQHWVDTGDARASPLLRSLTGYLRAVLPLFRQERLPLGDELDAVQRYLEVMRSRLGPRFRFAVEADTAARRVSLPPAVVLTLVENAVEHGAQRALGDAELQLRAGLAAGLLTVEVIDNGPGLPEPMHEGLGLSNSRQRLAQAYGSGARLALLRRPEGGTLARIELPAA